MFDFAWDLCIMVDAYQSSIFQFPFCTLAATSNMAQALFVQSSTSRAKADLVTLVSH